MNPTPDDSRSAKPDPDRIALGIRQPWVELIMRGIKTIEVRSQDTRVRGPIYVYASKKTAETPAARRAQQMYGIELEQLPRGLVVGSVEICESRRIAPDDAEAACLQPVDIVDCFGWSLKNPVRFESPLEVAFLPYGVWFYPWKRRGALKRRSR